MILANHSLSLNPCYIVVIIFIYSNIMVTFSGFAAVVIEVVVVVMTTVIINVITFGVWMSVLKLSEAPLLGLPKSICYLLYHQV